MEKISFFATQNLPKDLFVSDHKHNCWEIVYYKTCLVKSEFDGKEFFYDKNTFAIIPPNMPHNELHYKNGVLNYIGFYSSTLNIAPGIYRDTPYHTVDQLCNLIVDECKRRYHDSEKAMSLLLEMLIMQLNRLQTPSAARPGNLSYAKHFIDENYSRKINFPDLAQSCDFTYDTFRRNFKKQYGASPKNYLIERRLQKAKQLLDSSEQNCTQIALECGFSDSSQFSTMFRAKYGVSPKQLTKQNADK